jgi:hypothetical protein
MITYKNISFSAKTFYGVEFKPGEIKSVPGYINCPSMVRIFTNKNHTKNKPQLSDAENNFISKRGRKKSNETEKASLAETESKIEISKEETTNGNPS